MCNTSNLLTESIPLRMHSWNMKLGSNMKSNPQVYDTRWHYIINATTFTGKANTGHCKSEMTCYQLILTTRFLFNIAFLWKKTCKNKSGSWPTFILAKTTTNLTNFWHIWNDHWEEYVKPTNPRCVYKPCNFSSKHVLIGRAVLIPCKGCWAVYQPKCTCCVCWTSFQVVSELAHKHSYVCEGNFNATKLVKCCERTLVQVH